MGEQRKAFAFVEKQKYSQKIGKTGNYFLHHKAMGWVSLILHLHYSYGWELVLIKKNTDKKDKS